MVWTPEARTKAREALARKPPSARQLAIAAGEVSFLGKACGKCGGTRWYVKSSQCVSCSTALQKDPRTAARKQAWNAENRDRIRAKRNAQYASGGQLAAIARARKWVAENPQKRKAISMTYKARRRAQEAEGDSTAEIAAWAASTPKVCYWCDKPCADKYHVDHYEPLVRGGRHAIANLVIACPKCNLEKNAKDPYVFALSRGRLF